AAVHAATPAARYTIVELSTPTGDTSEANAVSNAGTVAGTVTNANGLPRATKWSASGTPTALGLLPGGSDSVANGLDDAGQGAGLGLARGINGRGQVVGGPGYVWRSGTVTNLPGLPGGGGTGSTVAYAINDNADVVGTAAVPGGTGTHAVFWRNGSIVDIGTV